MADWLNDQVLLPVRLVREGERPLPGQILLAGTDDHLHLLADGTLRYTEDPKESLYRPSIDVFFHSVAQHWRGTAVGVLLTGMGQDGARGLKALRERGYLTIAQDQATSAVYGMPKAAAALQAALGFRGFELACGHGAARRRPGDGRRSDPAGAGDGGEYRFPLLLRPLQGADGGDPDASHRHPAGSGSAGRGWLEPGAGIPQPSRHARHPDYRAVHEGRPGHQERGLCCGRQRLSGEVA
ncbi:hypothetical protein G6F31_015228 [Rhizopus arrhizus]|nr:hypothetical protein G6F31_015228 [Rhizopus arrhizus]